MIWLPSTNFTWSILKYLDPFYRNILYKLCIVTVFEGHWSSCNHSWISRFVLRLTPPVVLSVICRKLWKSCKNCKVMKMSGKHGNKIRSLILNIQSLPNSVASHLGVIMRGSLWHQWLLGIVVTFCFWYCANLSELITFYLPWYHQRSRFSNDFKGNRSQSIRLNSKWNLVTIP